MQINRTIVHKEDVIRTKIRGSQEPVITNLVHVKLMALMYMDVHAFLISSVSNYIAWLMAILHFKA